MRVSESVVVVTGGASGLGEATAEAVVRAGGQVVIADLPTSPGARVAAELGPRAIYVPVDIVDEAAMAVAFDSASELGPLRGVVHCAGRGGDRLRVLDKELEPSPLDKFVDVLTVNAVGTYNVLRMAAAHIARTEPVSGERGAILLTASIAAFDGQIGQTSYAASKGAVHSMTLVAARDLASLGIRVNTIAPGLFDTPMLARLRQDIRDELAAGVPFPKRLGNPSDYASMALALLENSYVNGETIRLDGSARLPAR